MVKCIYSTLLSNFTNACIILLSFELMNKLDNFNCVNIPFQTGNNVSMQNPNELKAQSINKAYCDTVFYFHLNQIQRILLHFLIAPPLSSEVEHMEDQIRGYIVKCYVISNNVCLHASRSQYIH